MSSNFDKWKEKKKREAAYTLKSMWKSRVQYAFLAPFAILFIVFYIAPVIISIFFSFTYYNILEPAKFIGLTNYTKLILADDIFLISVQNTFLLAVITGPLGYIMAFLFAWLIHETPKLLRSILVLIFYAPSIAFNMYMIFGTFFSSDAYGWANALLIDWGFINAPILWLTDPKYMMTVIIIVALWMSLGSGFLSFIAGLQTVGVDQYEAGYVDGIKNRWQELWFITLPNMKPMLLFGAVMAIMQSFSFGEVANMLCGNPSTDYKASTVVTHLMDYGSFRFDMGYASAIATILFLAMIFTKKGVNAMLDKVGT
ncbi:sugar ABC transporter permease [Mobilitalea sibirica]|uniref:Sugar ABC transporter permease n=1 Tax=Mobilitalea sibirica TaxID=1462919 RepID=A0A8J7HDS9_9FIRM|nr:sugar ABC transporter permease [Mobilitalea sibirica]MBH1941134.1 sugar ABC transporter permease [Mobilitalea sibirica]